VQASPFQLQYSLDQFRIPQISDYAGVTDLTDQFMDGVFKTVFQGTGVDYVSSNISRAGQNFLLNQPVQVFYNTTVSFGPSSSQIPQPTEINSIVALAFSFNNSLGQGPQYLSLLATLPSGNIFSTTYAVTYIAGVGTKSMPNTEQSSGGGTRGGGSATAEGTTSGGTNVIGGGGSNGTSGSSGTSLTMTSAAKAAGIAVAAGAGVFIVIVAAVMTARRRETYEFDEMGKYLHEDGQVTVTEETVTTSGDSQTQQRSATALGAGNGAALGSGSVTEDAESPTALGIPYSTPTYRTASPSDSLEEGQESDASNPSSENSSPSTKHLETVDL